MIHVDPKTQVALAKHLISKPGRFTTNEDHLPPQKQMASLHSNLLSRASHLGTGTRALVEAIFATDPYRSIRSVQGILSLTRTYNAQKIEQAATLCLQRGLTTYRAVKTLLEHQVQHPQQAVTPPLAQTHECIRSSGDYHSLWDECTQPPGETPCL